MSNGTANRIGKTKINFIRNPPPWYYVRLLSVCTQHSRDPGNALVHAGETLRYASYRTVPAGTRQEYRISRKPSCGRGSGTVIEPICGTSIFSPAIFRDVP